MYHKNDLQVVLSKKDNYYSMYDERENDFLVVQPPVAQLPHSCDEWIIGGTKQIKLLIKDLQNALIKIHS